MTAVTIYALCDPVALIPRYVGKANDLAARMRVHRAEMRDSRFQTRKVRWLRSLGVDPTVFVLAEVPKEDWETAERFWIAELRRQGCDLTNFADGGQTSPVEGKRHTEESKAKMRAATLRLGLRPPSRSGTTPWNKGQSMSDETRARLSAVLIGRMAWNKGVKATPELIEKNRRGHAGKPWSVARRSAQERNSA